MKKIKKLLLLTMLFALVLSLTGCGKEEPAIPDGLNFEVDGMAMQSYTQAIINQYHQTSEVDQEYYLEMGNNLAQTAVKGFMAAETTDHVGDFIRFNDGPGSYKVRNGADGKVVFSQYCKYEHRDVEVKISYSKNAAYEYDKEKLYNDLCTQAEQYNMDVATYVTQMYGTDTDLNLTSMEGFLESALAKYYGEYPYVAEECEVSPVYTKTELMKKAGVNTGIGMGVVFIVLIFISFVISLLKYLPMLFDADIRKENVKKKQAHEDAKKKTEDRIIASSGAKTAEKAAAADDSENLMNDSELVAVITAALYAATSGATGGAVRGPAYTASNDKLVVRSIRRAKR